MEVAVDRLSGLVPLSESTTRRTDIFAQKDMQDGAPGFFPLLSFKRRIITSLRPLQPRRLPPRKTNSTTDKMVAATGPVCD
jgi:hypothetical protein